MKFRKTNFYNGYKGYAGTELDQTESEFYDDLPAPDQKELMLKVLAGGQIAEERRRAAYYDEDESQNLDPDDINEIDAGAQAQEFDYVSAYREHFAKKVEYWRMAHGMEQSDAEPEQIEPNQSNEKKAQEPNQNNNANA